MRILVIPYMFSGFQYAFIYIHSILKYPSVSWHSVTANRFIVLIFLLLTSLCKRYRCYFYVLIRPSVIASESCTCVERGRVAQPVASSHWADDTADIIRNLFTSGASLEMDAYGKNASALGLRMSSVYFKNSRTLTLSLSSPLFFSFSRRNCAVNQFYYFVYWHNEK